MATALSAYTPTHRGRNGGARKLCAWTELALHRPLRRSQPRRLSTCNSMQPGCLTPTKYPEPWMRVEAVRQALFRSAALFSYAPSRERLGNGILRAKEALALAPMASSALQKRGLDSAGLPFLNVFSSRGLAPTSTDAMLQLEATQLVQRWSSELPNPLEAAVADPDRPADDVPPQDVERFLAAVAEHPQASNRLKARARDVLAAAGRVRVRVPRSAPDAEDSNANNPNETATTSPATIEAPFEAPKPPCRKLRGFAVDPSLATRLDTVNISEVTFEVPWENVKPGPIGEYLEVVDVDPASQTFYAPVDLNAPALLAQDGLPPSEGTPQFHQQMVYAVASLTIRNFEVALGRRALWRPGPPPTGANKKDDSHYVPRLRIYPHALREANAYYSPSKIALLFGYFDSVNVNDGLQLPAGRVFTCLSHDIVAHETTHALLDGMNRRFLSPSNPDVLAFHEGFADCVAMLQHFTFPKLVPNKYASRAVRSPTNKTC